MSAVTFAMSHRVTELLLVYKKDKQGGPHRLRLKKKKVYYDQQMQTEKKKTQDKAEGKQSECNQT